MKLVSFLGMKLPIVSIILSTYNRSNILGYSIETVINQTFTEWELIVVGDCCTDDSETVVANFKDSRITFINLEENFGEQSEPNNVGIRRTKGDYIAFINHDDLWFSDHLEFSLHFLKTSGADIVLAAGFIDYPDRPNDCSLSGVISEKMGYHPSLVFVPATNWLLKRELIGEVGFWHHGKNLYLAPSHDWLKRAFEKGKRILPTKHFSVIALPSSARQNSYRDRAYTDSKYYFEELRHNSKFREQLAMKHLYPCSEMQVYDESVYLKRFVLRKCKQLLIWFGVNTIDLNFRKKYGKGGLIAGYRKVRGLE